MSNFTHEEILNEVSRIIGGYIEVDKNSGVTDGEKVYTNIMGISTVTFLLYPNSIFYLAKLICNSLVYTVKKEAAIVEDILVSLEEINNLGVSISDVSELNNANTALLTLDSAVSIKGRNELNKFVNQLNLFNEKLRKNIVIGEKIVNTRQSAQKIINNNLVLLKKIHADFLLKLDNLLYLLDNFSGIDIQSKAASDIFKNVLDELNEANEILKSDNNAEFSRLVFLKNTACAAAVKMISEFKNPLDVKYRSPIKPIPSGISHLGRVAGNGVSPEIVTSFGPWVIPKFDVFGKIEFKVNGGPVVDVSINISGPVLSGENEQTFSITASNCNLNVVVDPNVYEVSVDSGNTNSITFDMPSSERLGFKHLNTMIQFPNRAGTDNIPRIVTWLDTKFAGTITNIETFPKYSRLTVSWFGSAPTAYWIGAAFYVTNEDTIFEILDVIGNDVYIRNRGNILTPGICLICGTDTLGDTGVSFSPPLSSSAVAGEKVLVGPTVKNGSLQYALGMRTADYLVSEFNNSETLSDFAYGSLGFNIEAILDLDSEGRIALLCDNKLSPYMQITNQYLYVNTATPEVRLDINSAHNTLGFKLGAMSKGNTLKTYDLERIVNFSNIGVSAVTNRNFIVGGNCSLTYGTKDITDNSTDFIFYGVTAGNLLEINSGKYSGIYIIESVYSNTLTIKNDYNFDSNFVGVAYKVVSENLSIKSNSSVINSSLEVIASPTVLGLTVGTVYGQMDKFEAVDKHGNNLIFNDVSPGDYLKITGLDAVKISSSLGSVLELDSYIPSNIDKKPFVINGNAANNYENLCRDLQLFLKSKSLFSKYGFNISLDFLDKVLTPIMTTGQSFSASLNRAKEVMAEFLSMLTTKTSRIGEYSVKIPVSSSNIESILAGYSAPRVSELDNLIVSLESYQYTRTLDLLLSGEVVAFFNTSFQDATYAGTILSTSRKVLRDLPEVPLSEGGMLNRIDSNAIFIEGPDADNEFWDYEE